MGIDANAEFFYGIKLSDENTNELKLRDQTNGKRYCKTCGAWLETHFCPNDGSQTESRVSLVGLDELRFWGDPGILEAAPHVPHSTVLALYYIDKQWTSPFYLYIKNTQVRTGDVRGGPRENEPKAIDLFGLTQTFNARAADDALKEGFNYLGLSWDTIPQFYLALAMGW